MSYGKEIEQEGIANMNENEDFIFYDEPLWEDRHPSVRRTSVTRTVKRTKKIDPRKPTLVIVGEHMIDPNDVSCIKKVRSKDDLYVINLKSQPNMEFPLWANAAEVEELMKHFNIVG